MARGVLFVFGVVMFLFASCEASDDECGSRSVGDCDAGGACVWCDLPQRCVSASEFGFASCFGVKRQRRLLEDHNRECGAIATKDLCSQVDYCKWCRSEVLDDTCFGAAESARLPRTIFLCSDVS